MSPVTNLDNRNSGPISDEVIATLKQLGASADAPTFAALAGDRYHRVPPEVMFLRDSILPFTERRVQGPADALITNRAALLAENLAVTIVHPSADGDVELCLDLGKEVVGWVEFSLRAPEGTLVDIYLVEYRNAERIQHTGVMRNGFRYVAQDGLNHFVSLKRLAGRYLFLTLREMTGPVKIQYARVLQATYPVERRGAFRCSDVALTHIWEISAYTLRLCMEDTYTDCPLYEQTLWVGDARNESLYNAICYGAHDLTLRCLRLCAQSLDTLPIVGSQLPSSWNGLLPAWSFLWGLNVWEYYFTTGDLAGLRELYPAVLRNLRNAQGYCTDRGLFSIPAWNFFDWTGIDDKSRTVLFNSLILLGAIDAALQCCATLGESDAPWLQDFHDELLSALLPLWDDAKGSYPDSIHDDGTVSASVCQHTSVLGVLYDALPPAARDIAVRHIIAPPEGMVRIGSPFALQYALEALEKSGDVAHALQLVRALWQDMLDCGATTCWETFRNVDAPFPTRSHCHAWSSAPIYMFNRLILGIVPTGVAASEVVVSPHPLDLTWAEGVSASVRGDLRVSWRREGETLSITVEMPAGVTWRVLANDDWRGITRVVINGVEHPELLPAVAGQFV
ncbi:MAG TPA: alpha-L-rhamnosidase C-terminal domain-containing protein [Armatimonadota bacterium]